MTIFRQACLALIASIAFCVAAGQEPQTATLPVGSAVIAEFKGEISLRSPQGDALTLNTGTVLPAESVIETMKGSSILLNLQDNSQVLIKANSHVVLKSPTEGRGDYLELLIGKILAKIQKRLGNAPSFRMGTPTAVITVRGTRFSVEVNKKQKTSVEVFEGIVEVAGFMQGAPPVLLRPGFHTGVEHDRGPDEPRQVFGGDDSNRMSGRGDDGSGISNRGAGGENSGRSGGQSGQSDHEHD
jgi:FecR-like protein